MKIRFVALASLFVACSEGKSPTENPPPTPVLTTINVSVAPTSVQVGQTATAAAAGIDQSGAPFALGAISWSSSASNVATVSQAGAITAIAAGQATIVASSGGKLGQATLTVTNPPPVLTTMTVTLGSASVVRGTTTTASAQGRDQYGAAIATGAVNWSSSDNSIATVSNAGTVTAVAAGNANIVATVGSITASAAITVTLPPPVLSSLVIASSSASVVVGTQATFTVTGRDQFGASIATGNVVWSASPSSVATINQSGIATGVAPGNATVTATAGGVSAQVGLVVTVPVCASKGALNIGVTTFGATSASSCLFAESNLALGIRGSDYAGPSASGTFFVDRYTIDIPAGAIVRLSFSQMSGQALAAVAYTTSGAFHSYGWAGPITINNPTVSTQSYQITVGSNTAGYFGNYNITPTRLN